MSERLRWLCAILGGLSLLSGCLAPPYAPPPPVVVEAPEPTDPAQRLAWMVGPDPLVRRPRLPTGALAADERGLPDLMVLSRDDRAPPAAWWDLERRYRGAAIVAMARGGRLAAVEALAGTGDAVGWLAPLAPATGPPPEITRRPLAFLGDPDFDTQLRMVERQVLLAWLDAPTIQVGPAADALGGISFDRLTVTPAGALVLARAAAPRDVAAGEDGLRLLIAATDLALRTSAADSDSEQVAARAHAESLRLEHQLDPQRPVAPALLDRAWTQLLRDAGDDRSAGLALVVIGASRWLEACPDKPCLGFDRIDVLHAASRWGDEPDALGRAWIAVAHKDTSDQIRAAYDGPFISRGLDRLYELLAGAGQPVEVRLVSFLRAEPAMHLLVQRTLGGPDLTEKEPFLRTLDNSTAAAVARATEVAPPGLQSGLEQLGKRVRR